MTRRLINLRLPPDLIARVDAAADRLGQTRTKFIERALESALGGSSQEPLVPKAPPVSSRAPDEPVATVMGAKVFKGSSVPAFKCPIARCEFRARSSAAKCGAHGRTVVPV